jgi:Holliday junction resolvase
MKNTNAAGANRERQVRAYFRERGFIAIKVSDSAVCDVVAMKEAIKLTPGNGATPRSIVLFIECKANKDGGPYSNFRAPEREALVKAAEQAGASALLCWWPPNREPSWINSSEWPSTERTSHRAAA